MKQLTVVIVTWNTRDLLAVCLDSVIDTASGLDVEIVVVDNHSMDGTREMLASRYPDVRLVYNDENVGFARANNDAVKLSSSKYLLLLNSDARLLPGAVDALLEVMADRPEAGIVGARLVNPDGTFQASHTSFPSLAQEFFILTGLGRLIFGRWYPSHGPEAEKGPRPIDYVQGACMLIRRPVFEQLGGLDEGYFMYAEEVDLCYSAHLAGWQVWYQPAAQVLHLGGASSRNRPTAREADLYRSRVRFFRKHRGDSQAVVLQGVIYSVTTVKLVVHSMLRRLSGGRLGRPVVGLSDLRARFRGA